MTRVEFVIEAKKLKCSNKTIAEYLGRADAYMKGAPKEFEFNYRSYFKDLQKSVAEPI